MLACLQTLRTCHTLQHLRSCAKNCVRVSGLDLAPRAKNPRAIRDGFLRFVGKGQAACAVSARSAAFFSYRDPFSPTVTLLLQP